MSTIVIKHNPNVDRFIAAMASQDDIGAVIRCHYEVEKVIDHIISHRTENRYSPSKTSMKYLSQKIEFLHLFGMHMNFIEILRSINRLRNRFAHQGQEKITEADVTELKGKLAKIMPVWDEDSPVRMAIDGPFEGKLKDLPYRQRYVLLVMKVTVACATLGNISVSD